MSDASLRKLFQPRGWEAVRVWCYRVVRRWFATDVEFEREARACGEREMAAEWLETWASHEADPHTSATLLNLAYGLRAELHHSVLAPAPAGKERDG